MRATTRPGAPSTASERFILTALVVTMVVNQTGSVIVSPLVVDIASAFDVSVGAAGQLRAVSALSSALIAPWIGLGSERLGRRALLLVGLAAIGASGLGSALAPTFWLLLAAQALGGVGIACLLSMGFAAVGDFFPPERRAWAMGVVMIGQPLAWVVGLPIIGLLADAWGWRWSFVGVPFLFSLVGLWFALRLPPPPSAQASSDPLSASALREILGDRSAAAWILAELCAYTGWAGTLTYLGAFYITRFGLSAGTASPLLALTAFGFIGGSLVAARLARSRAPQVVVLAAACVSAVLIALALGRPLALLAAVGLLTGFGLSQGVRGATSNTLGLKQAPRYRGTMMALRASVVQLGYVLGGVVGGLVLERGGYAALGFVFGLMIAAGGLGTLLLVEDRPG